MAEDQNIPMVHLLRYCIFIFGILFKSVAN